MSIRIPTLQLSRVTDINPQLVKSMGIKAVLLDVDNTITSYISKEPFPGSIDLIRNLEAEGIKVYIVSNNKSKKRIKAVAEKFSLPFVNVAMKPFPVGFIRAKLALKVKFRECLVVGDQIYTDIIGANLCGMQSILLEPIEVETGWTFKIRRHFEERIRAEKKTARK
ncbi:MAG: YqeG family HAD IIIA-type phosphatase [Clostridia bacterium]|nr:YqeG family HAD IIIA-type phosphatase [Clostridia bacterium]